MSRSGDKGPNLALRHERELRGWSQADLAEKIGVEVVTISRWERGTNAPTSAYTIKKLCDLFGKTREELGFFSKTLDEPAMTPPTQEASFEPRNPYKGLRAFRGEDACDFFGRDQLIDDLTNKLEKILKQKEQGSELARLLAVIGPSGSGKSSVVMAGLLPRLQAGELPESKQWVYLRPMVPGTHPLEALAVTLGEYLPERSLTNIREDLQDDTARGLHLLAASIAKQPETKVVLVVDQFEELFVQTTDEQERKQFIDLLLTASTERDGPVLVMLTLRADFYDRPMYYAELGEIIEAQSKSVFPMNVRELQAIIEQPAALPDVQLTFEGDLVGDLLFEVQGQVGALPLLQFTLDQLFQRRNGRQLTLSAYRELGGVKGALTRQAEETYAALPSEEHRKLACALFVRLIDPGVLEQDTTRRRAALLEFSLPEASQTRRLREVANAFIATRLLTTNEIAGTTTIEVSHEALIRAWPRLAGWLRETRDDIPLQQTISKDVTEWEQHNKPGDRLYHGSQLKEAQAWAKRNTPSGNEVAFLRAGAVRRLRTVASVTVIVLLLLSTTGVAGWLLSHIPPDPTRVSTLQDNDNPGTLRYAIEEAPIKGTITFDASLHGPILLTNRDLNIAKDLTIRGPDTNVIFISGNYGVHIASGASVTISHLIFKDGKLEGKSFITNDGTLTLANSTVSGNTASGGGGASSSGGGGGGIFNDGTLTLANSTVSGNTASGGGASSSGGGASSSGGGISNDGGTLTLANSTVSGNTASGGGGGISNDSGTLTPANSTVSGNTANGGGGGISNYGGTLTPANSTFSGNMANSGGGGSGGGGIFNYSGTLTLTNSTVSGNTANGSGGGGISNYDGTLTLANSTFSGNTANGSGGSGGGIFNYYGTLTLTNSTFSGNTANGSGGASSIGGGSGGSGGGISNYYGGTLTLTNSTFSGNMANGSGGGIYIQGIGDSSGSGNIPFVDLTFSTIYGNTAHSGADIEIEDVTFDSNGNSFKAIKQRSQLDIRNSIVAGDSAHPGQDISGTFISYGYNLFQDNSGATFDPATSTQHSTDKIFSVNDLAKVFADPVRLQDNHDPTKIYRLALGTSNPAIDKVPLDACHITVPIMGLSGTPVAQYTITTDQRGMKRPDDGEDKCDIGAYESP